MKTADVYFEGTLVRMISMSPSLGHLAARSLKIDGGNQFTYGVQGTAGGCDLTIEEAGKSRDLYIKEGVSP